MSPPVVRHGAPAHLSASVGARGGEAIESAGVVLLLSLAAPMLVKELVPGALLCSMLLLVAAVPPQPPPPGLWVPIRMIGR